MNEFNERFHYIYIYVYSNTCSQATLAMVRQNKLYSVVPSLSNASFENTDASEAQNPAETAYLSKCTITQFIQSSTATCHLMTIMSSSHIIYGHMTHTDTV